MGCEMIVSVCTHVANEMIESTVCSGCEMIDCPWISGDRDHCQTVLGSLMTLRKVKFYIMDAASGAGIMLVEE